METSPAESSRGDSPPPAARQSPTAQPLLIPTRAADSLAWMRPDVVLRLVPLAGLVVAIWLYSRPAWLGLGLGWTEIQLAFGLPGLLIFFAAACLIQRVLTRQRGSLRVPASGSDVALQTGYYLVNAPIEEAFFRGLVQGGLTVAVGPVLGILAGTSLYVLYHRLGRWGWPEVLATSLVGLPTALAFWLLPGPPSILAVSLAHAGATCGFLGPGPWLLNRLGLISGGDSPPPAAGQGPSAQPPLLER
jgi:membrane protease YdiL (CAAX protease family)